MKEQLKDLLQLAPDELKATLQQRAQTDEISLLLYRIWDQGRAWGMEYTLKMSGMTKAETKQFFDRVDAGADRYELLGMKPAQEVSYG